MTEVWCVAILVVLMTGVVLLNSIDKTLRTILDFLRRN